MSSALSLGAWLHVATLAIALGLGASMMVIGVLHRADIGEWIFLPAAVAWGLIALLRVIPAWVISRPPQALQMALRDMAIRLFSVLSVIALASPLLFCVVAAFGGPMDPASNRFHMDRFLAAICTCLLPALAMQFLLVGGNVAADCTLLGQHGLAACNRWLGRFAAFAVTLLNGGVLAYFLNMIDWHAGSLITPVLITMLIGANAGMVGIPLMVMTLIGVAVAQFATAARFKRALELTTPREVGTSLR